MKLLAAVGDSNHVRTWSGIPYHLLQAARPLGVIDQGLPLDSTARHWAMRRLAWNAQRWLRGKGKGGFQFSEAFLERLWRPARDTVLGATIVNTFQLYPRSIVDDSTIRCWFYIDQTLRQLFEYYGVGASIGAAIRQSALDREAAGYRASAGVIAHSHWAAQSVIDDYGIDPAKVHVVVPGANLDPEIYTAWAAERAAADRPVWDNTLRLVFVGRDPQRKGLDRLIRGLLLAEAQGVRCTLSVVGATPDMLPQELRRARSVRWLGLIDKGRQARQFFDVVANHDVGCLLSRAEAGGIGLREYHALGLAVIGPRTGGAPDHMLREAAIMVEPQASDRVVADAIARLWRDPRRVERMRALSWARRAEFSWQHAATQLGRILAD